MFCGDVALASYFATANIVIFFDIARIFGEISLIFRLLWIFEVLGGSNENYGSYGNNGSHENNGSYGNNGKNGSNGNLT